MKLSELLERAKPYVWEGTAESWATGLKASYVCCAVDLLCAYNKDLWPDLAALSRDRRRARAFIMDQLDGLASFVMWKHERGVDYPTIFAQQQARLQWVDNLVAQLKLEDR